MKLFIWYFTASLLLPIYLMYLFVGNVEHSTFLGVLQIFSFIICGVIYYGHLVALRK